MTPEVTLQRMEMISALTLLYEWGVDEVMLDSPQDRFAEVEAEIKAAVPSELPRKMRTRSPEGRAEEHILPANGGVPAGAPVGGAADLSETGLLARTAMHQLKAHYVEGAPILIVGEVPDAEEDRTGQLFSGESGALLERMLASIGVARADLSFVPAVPWRPPGGRPLSASEMQACRPLLQEALRQGRPKRIVTLGVTPLRMLCGEKLMLGRARGRWVDITVPGIEGGVPLLPMYHPAQLKVGPLIRRKLWEDLLSLRQSLQSEQ
ncbi:bacteriophage-type DNA polymerase [Neokomagataea thailandica NBRC 106555]|uniref:Uracil-DNA glycosylase n=2 Tax=Neokomagataea TaxID=1223423 RepID=A0A4Y6V9R7_9PROT|nr:MULTISPECIES: uracil-DNA glycosylase [Neokomagataea]QDH25105.1 uracil-DNA glycosylase [Neokomagataea tanensis]GBR52142.1 bacteriophage-type DNA polymerase [Neokomagataea thailandica NBRC 106555]